LLVGNEYNRLRTLFGCGPALTVQLRIFDSWRSDYFAILIYITAYRWCVAFSNRLKYSTVKNFDQQINDTKRADFH